MAMSNEDMAQAAHDELTGLLSAQELTPVMLRRVAELYELIGDLHGEAEKGQQLARPWWEAAAKGGDQDAIDILEVLHEEEEEEGKKDA